MSIKIKPNAGVSMVGIQPQTVLGMVIVNGVFERHGLDMVITDIVPVYENFHKPHTLHWKGFAFDVRHHDVAEEMREAFLEECQEALGREWDCVQSLNNFHYEWDPE